ncbi:methyltransferase domain-containing protein [Kineococcus sp. T13]|uniref:methyltransferase domain-containing protein n=1 Tax=Kineococcus vitellinus TaxID=2696565 RepID=UPI001412CECF|nr:methyltransferase domain-containing protein [Kineococcus vitellinus]
MSLVYAVAHRIGLTPWERAGAASAGRAAALLAREEAERSAPRGAPHGSALDLGCGSGAHAVALAERGWRVTAVDAVGVAVARARARALAHGVDVRVVQADVTRMGPELVGGDVDLFLDVGCFHGLRDAQRAAMGRCVTACAAGGATMLVLAFRPGRRGPLPRGADRADLAAAYPGWDLLEDAVADVSGLPLLLRGSAPHWYRLRRS